MLPQKHKSICVNAIELVLWVAVVKHCLMEVHGISERRGKHGYTSHVSAVSIKLKNPEFRSSKINHPYP